MNRNSAKSASFEFESEGLTRFSPHPSRYSNPFATCWTRPGAFPFQFSNGQSEKLLIAQLAAQQWRGAIIGPHGSGKSTLLETLKPALRAAGFQIYAITLRNRQRRLPAGFFLGGPEPHSIAIIDGYEQLGWFERTKLNRLCRRAECGLLVTTHSATRIPTLLRLAPDKGMVQRLVEELASRVPTPVTPADVAASHACHASNVREILFDLYDRHEKLRRAERTLTVPRA